jgi:sec-independent protein translocase protein TatA
VIAFIALIVFGPKRLPELGKGLGQAIRGFKKELDEDNPEERK